MTNTNTNQAIVKANANMIEKKATLMKEKFLENATLTEEELKQIELMSDEKFIEKLQNTKSIDEFQAAMKEVGIEMTAEETKEYVDSIVQKAGKVVTVSDELSDEELAEIAGGSTWDVVKGILKDVGKAYIGMMLIAGAAVLTAATGGVAAPAIIAGMTIGLGAYSAGLFDFEYMNRE